MPLYAFLFFRKTSCSSGWLRLVLQSIFAVITVTSFILIVIMSVKSKPRAVVSPVVQMRCHLQSCRVICNDAPYYEEYEDDIIYAVMDAQNKCGRVYLELHQPFFTNGTLPCNWLSKLLNDVNQLAIFGGNLMHIPSGAFMSQFAGSIETLHLTDLRIQTLEPNSFVGLSKLRTLNIIYSWLDGVEDNALRAVDDTLETLTVTRSADWDPAVFTGFRGLEKLTTVDFSNNDFNTILNERSFVGLEVTRILYLNSCKIISIKAGAFDHLTSIEVLYLNDNLLTTVPVGLFEVIIPLNDPRPRVHLQDNYWFCDCAVNDLRLLARNEILLVEVECTSPDEFKSMTFTEFDSVCSNNERNSSNNNSYSESNKSYNNIKKIYPEPVYVNKSSCKSIVSRISPVLVSVLPNNLCTSKKFQYVNLTNFVGSHVKNVTHKNKWLKLSYIITTENFSVVEISAISEKNDFGLLWYEPDCPQEIYCLDVIPTNLKVYNTDINSQYTFCPIFKKSLSIDYDNCFDVSARKTETFYVIRLGLYLATMILCCFFGAAAVYSLIRRKPILLKGSKRLIFVKHKNIDALVLPPKIPLRDDLINPKDKEVFTLTSSYNDKLKPPNMQRMKSVRSDKSETPSYISAVQPMEDQMGEWPIGHHFNNDLTISSRKSELSTLSWSDSAYYYSFDDADKTYESLK